MYEELQKIDPALRDEFMRWAEIAAMHATEAGILFGHGKVEDGLIELWKGYQSATMAKFLISGDEKCTKAPT